MIESEIERKIVERIRALDIQGLKVHGSWQPSTIGALKDEENPGDAIVCAVAVSPCAFRSYRESRAEMEVAVATVFRADLLPDGSAMVVFCDALLSMIRAWNFDRNGELDRDLATDRFSPGGLLMNGGTAPEYDQAGGVWTVTQNFTLSGVCLD